jgi:ribonuclease HI
MTDKAPSADVLLFADGACSGNPGPGGWGFILRHPASDKETRDSGATRMTTNNRMELTAVIEGLRALRASRRWRVHVVTDSEYVARGMNEWIAKWIANGWRRGKGRDAAPVLNADLWKELHGLCSRHEVTFEHVRGHSGHLENEECDRMAAAAIKELRLNE